MKVSRFGTILATAAALMLVVSGCGAADGEGASGGGAGTQSKALTAEQITTTLESNGFECEEKEPRGKDREQVIECRADNYVFITATRLSSVEVLESQIVAAKEALCKSEMGDGFTSATSGTWILVPGGSRDIDMDAFDKAMNDLGLEWAKDLC